MVSFGEYINEVFDSKVKLHTRSRESDIYGVWILRLR